MNFLDLAKGSCLIALTIAGGSAFIAGLGVMETTRVAGLQDQLAGLERNNIQLSTQTERQAQLVEQLQQDLQKCNREITNLSAQLAEKEAKIRLRDDQIKLLRVDIEDKATQISTITQELVEIRRRLKQSDTLNAQLQAENIIKQKRFDTLSQKLRQLETTNESLTATNEDLKALAGLAPDAEFIAQREQMAKLRETLQQQSAQLVNLEVELAHRAAQIEQTEAKLIELKNERKQLAVTMENLKMTEEQKTQEIIQITDQLKNKEKQIAKLEQDLQKRQDRINELNSQLSNLRKKLPIEPTALGEIIAQKKIGDFLVQFKGCYKLTRDEKQDKIYAGCKFTVNAREDTSWAIYKAKQYIYDNRGNRTGVEFIHSQNYDVRWHSNSYSNYHHWSGYIFKDMPFNFEFHFPISEKASFIKKLEFLFLSKTWRIRDIGLSE